MGTLAPRLPSAPAAAAATVERAAELAVAATTAAARATVRAAAAETLPTRPAQARGRWAVGVALACLAGFLGIFGSRARQPEQRGGPCDPAAPPASPPPAPVAGLWLRRPGPASRPRAASSRRSRSAACGSSGFASRRSSRSLPGGRRSSRPSSRLRCAGLARSPARTCASCTAPLGGSSFPSGHVITYMGIYGFLAYLAHTLLRPRGAAPGDRRWPGGAPRPRGAQPDPPGSPLANRCRRVVPPGDELSHRPHRLLPAGEGQPWPARGRRASAAGLMTRTVAETGAETDVRVRSGR